MEAYHVDFINKIKALINFPDHKRATAKPLFQFEMTAEAAEKNAQVLETFDFNLLQAIEAQKDSPVYFGSEFQHYTKLEPLLYLHPFWPQLKIFLRDGATFPLRPISHEERIADLGYHLARGNHKSATNPEGAALVRKLMGEDITHGFSLVLPVSCITDFQDRSSIAPLGVQDQKTINELGELIQKWRMTHDQTFPGSSGLSVNKRVIEEDLPPCLYGHALRRLIHLIVKMREENPTTKILVGKFDLKAAYRRAHLSAATALESMTVFDNLLHVSLRMTFGGAPCPPQWGCFSETICDLANDLINCPAWNPHETCSPLQKDLPAPIYLAEAIPYAQAKPMAVPVPTCKIGKSEVYIDDFLPVALDKGDNSYRVSAAVPLAIHSVGRQISPNEPLPREDLISYTKMLAEAAMSETKTALGWLLNTRTLQVSLPDSKFIGWTHSINHTLGLTSIDSRALETLVGRLNHAASILHAMRQFLNRIRHLQFLAALRSDKRAKMTSPVKEDLILCKEFLAQCNSGISMNLLTYRQPTHVYRSDACEHGLGGYAILSGKAWRYSIPVDCQNRATINVLEFLGCIVSVWIDILAGELPEEACILSQTDSTSAAGWLQRSSFNEKQHQLAMDSGRHLARLTINSKTCLYSQWIPGAKNDVSDILSRDDHLTDNQIVALVTYHFPHQIPNGLRIQSLPEEIDSWLTSKLRSQPEATQLPKPPVRSMYGAGSDGSNIWTRLESRTTNFSTPSLAPNAIASLAHLWQPCAAPDSAPLGLYRSKPSNASPPWTMWHRPSGLTTGRILDTTVTGNALPFYTNKSEE